MKFASLKRVTHFAGQYGSGKTNIAVNYALTLKKEGKAVKIADLDIVNPYFRTKDSAKELKKAGIELISPAFANTNVDLPALPAEVYSLMQQKNEFAVLDIGGDDRGAYALGRYRDYILEENDYEMIFVANFYRPLTTIPEEALEVMREIEAASKLPFTAIVNNSNLGNATTPEDIEKTNEKAKKLSEISSLPLLFTVAEEKIADKVNLENVFGITLQNKYFDIKI